MLWMLLINPQPRAQDRLNRSAGCAFMMMAQSLVPVPAPELKTTVLPYGRMPLDKRDRFVAQKIYRHKDPVKPEPPELDKKA
jgi:hypothetical protein